MSRACHSSPSSACSSCCALVVASSEGRSPSHAVQRTSFRSARSRARVAAARHYRSCVIRMCGVHPEIDHVTHNGMRTKLGVFPIGANWRSITEAAQTLRRTPGAPPLRSIVACCIARALLRCPTFGALIDLGWRGGGVCSEACVQRQVLAPPSTDSGRSVVKADGQRAPSCCARSSGPQAERGKDSMLDTFMGASCARDSADIDSCAYAATASLTRRMVHKRLGLTPRDATPQLGSSFASHALAFRRARMGAGRDAGHGDGALQRALEELHAAVTPAGLKLGPPMPHRWARSRRAERHAGTRPMCSICGHGLLAREAPRQSRMRSLGCRAGPEPEPRPPSGAGRAVRRRGSKARASCFPLSGSTTRRGCRRSWRRSRGPPHPPHYKLHETV